MECVFRTKSRLKKRYSSAPWKKQLFYLESSLSIWRTDFLLDDDIQRKSMIFEARKAKNFIAVTGCEFTKEQGLY